MRKLILSLVFVLATGTVMNASSNDETLKMDSCFQDAWDYGTELGTSDYGEWFYMNEYYDTYCG
jgi:hypothetical protein|tara:strand:- start:2942 stop:3133 length:192 start_codon:yes stop_codon:yes gene_type:complete